MATGEQIYKWFQEGTLDPLEFAQSEIEKLVKAFRADGEGLRQASMAMGQAWQGDAAEGATKGIGPLIDSHVDSAGLIADAGSSISTQKDLFASAKHSVQPVPAQPEEPSMWAKGAAAVLPGTQDFEVSYRDGMNAHNEANANNVRVMDQYGSGTGQTRGELPDDYGMVEDDGAAFVIGSTHASSSIGGLVDAPNVGSPGYSGGSGGSSGVGPIGGQAPSFGGGGSAPGGGSGSVPPGGGGGPAPAPGGPAPAPGPGVRPGPIGGIAPISPIGGSPGGDDSRRPARGTTGARPPAGSSRAGARMTGTGPGTGGGKASTVLRGGAAANARLTGGTAGLQAGKGAAALPGAGAGTGGAGGAAAAKAAGGIGGGRGGAGGMMGGGAGAGAGRGQGDDDGEHKDKYYVKEEFDDGLAVEYDELGAKTIDDQTGNTVVSPVIGEPDYQPDNDTKS